MPTPTSTSVSLTPAESAASVSSFFAALASASPQQPGSGLAPGEGDPNDVGGDGNAGAEGTDTESITLSTGAIIAIAVVVGGVIIIGSMYPLAPGTHKLLTITSRHGDPLVLCKETFVGGPSINSSIG